MSTEDLNENKDIFIEIRGEVLLNVQALTINTNRNAKTDLNRCFQTNLDKMATYKQKF